MGPVNEAFLSDPAAFGRPGSLAFDVVGLGGRLWISFSPEEKAHAPRAISPLTTGGATASLRPDAVDPEPAAVGEESGWCGPAKRERREPAARLRREVWELRVRTCRAVGRVGVAMRVPDSEGTGDGGRSV